MPSLQEEPDIVIEMSHRKLHFVLKWFLQSHQQYLQWNENGVCDEKMKKMETLARE